MRFEPYLGFKRSGDGFRPGERQRSLRPQAGSLQDGSNPS